MSQIILKLKSSTEKPNRYYEREISPEDLELAIVQFLRDEDGDESITLEAMYTTEPTTIIS